MANLIFQFSTVVATEKTEKPDRQWQGEKHDPRGQQFSFMGGVFRPFHSLPSQDDQAKNGHQINQWHENSVKLVPFMHTGNAVTPVFPIHFVLGFIF